MNCKVKEFIGNTMGRVMDLDVPEDRVCWCDFLKVIIECVLKKIIARGRTVSLDGSQIWVPFYYEKLMRMRFKCGHIVHPVRSCAEVDTGKGIQKKWKE